MAPPRLWWIGARSCHDRFARVPSGQRRRTNRRPCALPPPRGLGNAQGSAVTVLHLRHLRLGQGRSPRTVVYGPVPRPVAGHRRPPPPPPPLPRLLPPPP